MTSHRKFLGATLAVAAGLATLAPAAAAYAPPYDRQYDDQARYDAQRAQQDQARRDYDAQYGPGAYDRYYGAQSDRAYREDRRACRQDKKGNEVAGGLL